MFPNYEQKGEPVPCPHPSPPLEAGFPAFVSKPIVSTIAKCQKGPTLLKLSAFKFQPTLW